MHKYTTGVCVGRLGQHPPTVAMMLKLHQKKVTKTEIKTG